MKARLAFQLACIALMMMADLASCASAQQAQVPQVADDQPSDLSLPGSPQVAPPPPTGVQPVDQNVQGAIDQVNPGLAGAYGAANGTFEEAKGNLPDGFLRLYADGMGNGPDGPDGRHGGFGEWSVVQDSGTTPAWTRQTGAAKSGQTGFGLAVDGGSYLPNTRSLLVSPELDLQTDLGDPTLHTADAASGGAYGSATAPASGLPDPTGGTVKPTVDQAIGTGAAAVHSIFSVSSLWRLVLGSRVTPATPGLQAVPSEPTCVPLQQWAAPEATYASECPWGIVASPEPLVELQFDARFNLAATGNAGQDTVQVLVYSKHAGIGRPTAVPIPGSPVTSPNRACDLAPRNPTGDALTAGAIVVANAGSGSAANAPCVVVSPISPTDGYGPGKPGPLAPSPAFNGASKAWQRYTIDLTPWSGDSVWVAFSFVSFGSLDNGFAPSIPFRGFQLDNAVLTAPGPPVSVRVRTPTAPGFFPSECASPCRPNTPVIAPGEPFHVSADVLNTGTTAATVQVSTSIANTTGAPLPGFKDVASPVTIPPGGISHVDVVFPGVPSSTADTVYHALVQADLVSPDPAEDADLSNNAQDLAFQALALEIVHQGTMQRTRATIPLGDVVGFSTEYTNIGTVPTTLVADACVLDAETVGGPDPQCGTNGLADLLDFRQVQQTVTIPPQQSVTLHWDVKGSREGQYRLFVSINDPTRFSAVDLLSGGRQPWSSVFTSTPPPVSNAIHGTPWAAAPVYQVPLANPQMLVTPGSAVQARLRILNDASNLYMRFDVDWPSPSNTYTGNVPQDALTLRLHHVGQPAGSANADDSLRIDGLAPPVDAHLDAPSLAWVPDAHQDTTALRTWNGNSPPGRLANYTFVLTRPLDGADPQDLKAAPGDLLSFFADVQPWWKPVTSAAAPVADVFAPLGASDVDGGMVMRPGFAARDDLQPPNAKLDDEQAAWQLVHLGQPAGDSGTVRFVRRTLSPGFGVDRSPPPFFAEDFQDCSTMAGWAQGYNSNPQPLVGQFGKWNCADYRSEGKSLLFVGLSPDSSCPGRPCPQSDMTSTGGFSGQTLYEVTTPPIEVPQVENPYLLLEHQFSSDAAIMDGHWDPDGPYFRGRDVLAQSFGRVYVETLDPATGNWGVPNLLVPEAGYTTEDAVGIRDLASGPRGLSCREGSFVDPLSAAKCGFWWPTGLQPAYRPQGAEVNSGATFRGSPWRLDRFPLTSQQYVSSGAAFVPSSTPTVNSTIRLVFEWTGSQEPPAGRMNYLPQGHGYGWRIGGLAIQEGGAFQRDLAVDDVHVKASLYDPAVLGLGPDTPIPVNVTVRNAGALPARLLNVRLQGFDPTQPDGTPLCWAGTASATGFDVALLIPPGKTANLTVECHGPDASHPGLAAGSTVTFRASVAALAGDDFPTDNSRKSALVYDVRRAPDAAVIIDASPRTSSQDTPRSLFVVVQNRGNVPLHGVNVTLDLQAIEGDQQPSTLKSTTWRIEDLPVGASYSLADHVHLTTTPRVERDPDLLFRPTDPGEFVALARASLLNGTDRDPGNDRSVVTMEALSRLYSDSLDGEPFEAPGVVSGDRTVSGTPDVWRIERHSLDGSNRLVAGDPATDEIPKDADASVVLPDMDLTTVRSATLTFVHRYDLEPSFDGGRLEISTDGSTWHSIAPVPQPLGGLPDGYPSIPLLGASPLLDGKADGTAVAFTGASDAIPSSRDGWMTSEFNLASDPDLRRTAALDDFRLDGFARQPDAVPQHSATGDNQFRSPTWSLNETNAEANQRYWWVDNVAYDVAPHSGSTMWWSGPGPLQPESGAMGQTGTDLAYHVAVPALHLQAEDILLTGGVRRVTDAASGLGASVLLSARPLSEIALGTAGGAYYSPSVARPLLTKMRPTSVAVGDVRLVAFAGKAAGTSVAAGDADVGAAVTWSGNPTFSTPPIGALCFIDQDRDGVPSGPDARYLSRAPCGNVMAGDIRLTSNGALPASTLVAASDPDVGQQLTAGVALATPRPAIIDTNGNQEYDAGEPVALVSDPTISSLSFWDWRPGADEGNAAESAIRYGTGGDYFVAPTALVDSEPVPASNVPSKTGIPAGFGDGLPDALEGPGHRYPTADPTKFDTDGDGWSDGAEVCLGTDPGNAASVPVDANSDSTQGTPDGLADSWATFWVNKGLAKPFSASTDNDLDGLTNGQEQMYCTAPILRDTDLDGLIDGKEVAQGLDPLEPMLLGRAIDTRTNKMGMPSVTTGVAEVGAGGWTRREVNLTSIAGRSLDLLFQYRSRSVPGNLAVADTRAADQNNLGWFMDDPSLSTFRIDPPTGVRKQVQQVDATDLEGLALDGAGHAGPWQSLANNNGLPTPRWSLVSQGRAALRPTGWHVQTLDVPGRGPTPAWSFSDPTVLQGYPKGEESRLVAPVVDLTTFAGTAARLEFDQKYGLEGAWRCPTNVNPCDARYPGAYFEAVDGGAVEYQVYDAANQAYGPWRQLGARFDTFPSDLLLEAPTEPVPVTGTPNCGGGVANNAQENTLNWACFPRQPMKLSATGQNLVRPAQTGYSAIMPRGDRIVMGYQYPTFFYEGALPIGAGASFQKMGGSLQATWPSGASTLARPWQDSPVSYVFSGTSPGVQGWQHVDWDISPLIGQKVRLAFHVASNPSFAGTQANLAGWDLANVAIQGDLFQGKPVQMRLHLATDATITKGEWSIDDLTMVGDRYHRNAAVLSATPDSVLTTPGASVQIEGTVSNLGIDPRTGLALGIIATDDLTKQDYTSQVTLDIDNPIPLTPVARAALPSGIARALAGISLASGGNKGSVVPFHVTVPLPPDAGSRIRVRLVLLEGDADHYASAPNELAGSGVHEWVLRGDTSLDVHLAPPTPGIRSLILPDPSVPQPQQPIAFTAAVRNNGTQASGLVQEWTLWRVQSKGSAAQPGTTERLSVPEVKRQDLPPIAQGATMMLHPDPPYVLGAAGLYRIQVRVLSGDVQQSIAKTEFLAGSNGQYYHVDFSDPATTGMGGWTDASPTPSSSTGGGSPPALAFRRDGTQILWGVNDSQLGQGLNYCSPAVGARCDGAAVAESQQSTSSPAIPNYRGEEGIALGPRIDLTTVPQGSAILTMRHGLNFVPGDGARLEALPLRQADGQPALLDCSGNPAWYMVSPIDLASYNDVAMSVDTKTLPLVVRMGGNIPKEDTPRLLHPLAPAIGGVQPILGGTGLKGVLTAFDMGAPAYPVAQADPSGNALTCGQAAITLVNYTVQLRLHVGTQPGYTSQHGNVPHPGFQGWQVQSIDLSSVGLAVTPPARHVAVRDGAAKQLSFQLTNLGQVPDQVGISLDRDASYLPDPAWIKVPTTPVTLAPGQQVTVHFGVDIPADPSLSRGSYLARIRAQSLRNPTTLASTDLFLDLQSNPLPDLAVSLSAEDSRSTPSFQAGTVAPIFATVANVGALASKPVRLRFSASRDGSSEVFPLDTVDVPGLCARNEPGCSQDIARTSATIEWLVPDVPGNYTVRAQADPDGRLVEARLDNDVAQLGIQVIPVQAPDLVLADLHVTGVGADGYAEKGALLAIRANVTNVGFRAARDVEVRILSGSSELADFTLASLQPGETRAVSAFKIASDGEYVLRAVVASNPAELRLDNNELRRVVRVREHGLAVSLDPPTVQLAPGATSTHLATITNNGTAVERVLLQLAGHPDWGFSATPNPVLVAPGGQSLVSVSVRAPAGALSGTQVLDVVAMPATNPNALAHGLLEVNVTAIAGDLRLSGAPLTASPGPAELLLLAQSSSNAPRAVRLVVAEPAWNHTPMPGTIAGSGNLTVRLPLTIPADASPGDHAVLVQAIDASGTAVAQATVHVQVLAKRSVAASWVGAPQRGVSGLGVRALVLRLHVANTGNVPFAAVAQLRDLAPGLAAGAPTPPLGLGIGEEGILTLALNATADAGDGLGGRADLLLSNVTTDGTGPAERALDLALPALADAPDLRIARVDLGPRQSVVAGTPVAIVLEVENVGPVDSPPSRLHAFANGYLLDDPAVPRVPAHGHVDLNMTVRFQDAGTYLLLFTADGEGQVTEMQTDNNGRSLTLDVRPPGVLSVDGLHRLVPAPEGAFVLLGLLAIAGGLRPRAPRRGMPG